MDPLTFAHVLASALIAASGISIALSVGRVARSMSSYFEALHARMGGSRPEQPPQPQAPGEEVPEGIRLGRPRPSRMRPR